MKKKNEPWKVVPVMRASGEAWTGLANIDCGGGRLLGAMNEQVALAVVAAHNGQCPTSEAEASFPSRSGDETR